MSKTKLLNFEYAWLQGCHGMVFGIITGFAAVFLHSRGYSNAETGAIMAAGSIATMILQPLVADFADRSRKLSLVEIIAAVTLVMAIALTVNIIVSGRSAVVCVAYSLYLCCMYLLQPLVSSLCAQLETWGVKINFGIARGIGSICFAVAVAVLGVLVERLSTQVLPVAGMMAALLQLVMLIVLRRQSVHESATLRTTEKSLGRSTLQFLKSNCRFILVLIGIVPVYFSQMVYISFTINVVENLGGSSADMGALSSYSSIIELPAMFLFSLLLRRWRCSTLLRFSCVMFFVKALGLYLAPSIGFLFVAQAFQSVSFALYIPAAVRYVNETIAPEDQVKGQAFMTTAATLSGIFATLLGGIMFDSIGVSHTLLVAAVSAGCGLVILLPAVKNTPLPLSKV